MLPSLGSLKLSNATEQINMHADARSQRVGGGRMFVHRKRLFIIFITVRECSGDGDHAAAATKKLI